MLDVLEAACADLSVVVDVRVPSVAAASAAQASPDAAIPLPQDNPSFATIVSKSSGNCQVVVKVAAA
jgi:hypothetical protein